MDAGSSDDCDMLISLSQTEISDLLALLMSFLMLPTSLQTTHSRLQDCVVEFPLRSISVPIEPCTPQLREDDAHGPSISRLAVFNYCSLSLPCSLFSYNHVSTDSSDHSCQNFSYQEEGNRSFGIDAHSCVKRVLQQTRFNTGFCASSAKLCQRRLLCLLSKALPGHSRNQRSSDRGVQPDRV